MSEQIPLAKKSRVWQISKSKVFSYYALPTYIILLSLIVCGGIMSPYFLTPPNIRNVLVQATPVLIVSIGQTFVILTGGIDISVGSVLTLSDCVAAHLMGDNLLGIVMVCALCLSIGAGAGLINGLAVTKLKVFPFVITLATMSIFQGIAFLVSPVPSGYIPISFEYLSRGMLGPVPLPVVMMGGMVFVAYLILSKTPLGRYFYAVGGNEENARLSGINSSLVKISSYMICGLLAAFGGLFIASRSACADPRVGSLYGFDSITAVLIGNTYLFGGQGGIGGTIAGAFIVAMLSNLLNMLGMTSFIQWILKGIIMTLAVSFTLRK